MRFRLLFVVLYTFAGAGSALSQITGVNIPGLNQDSGGSRAINTGDPSVAVGRDVVAQFVNGAFAVYDKVSGTRRSLTSDRQFWSNAGISAADLAEGLSSPRILFDPTADRWVAVQATNHQADNRLLLAVSVGRDASPSVGNWHAVGFAGNSGSNATYSQVRFPTLGLDANGVHIGTANYISTSGGEEDLSNSLFSIPRSNLFASSGPSLARMTSFYGTTENVNDHGFIVQPVVDFGAAKPRSPVLAVNYQQFGLLNRTDIIGSNAAGATLSDSRTVEVQQSQFAPSPRQPDGTGRPSSLNGIDSFDDRIGATVYRVGDLVYLTRAIGEAGPRPTHSSIRWTILRIAGEETEVVQEGTVSDPRYDFFTPSIAANADGRIVLAFNRSGPNGLEGAINAFFAVGTPDDSGLVTFGDIQQASFSTIINYHNDADPDSWGQYSSISIDPDNANVFWASQSVPLSSDTWGTQLTQIVVPEPSGALVGMTTVLLGLTLRRYRP